MEKGRDTADAPLKRRQTSPGATPSARHKRTLSGGILAKIPFLRPSSENLSAPATKSPHPTEHNALSGEPVPSRGAMAGAMKQSKTRKRKGSLRKTALLGTGNLRRPHDTHFPSTVDNVDLAASPGSVDDHEAKIEPRQFTSYDSTADRRNSDSTGGPHSRSGIDSPVTSPTGNAYASTTDDDEHLGFPRPGMGSTSYFPSHSPSVATLQRRRSNKTPQQLAAPPALPPTHAHVHHGGPPTVLISSDDEWDYTETEWWGWLVLVVTWAVFVVGMGSCLDVWRWAWDVGETPYAPPELEDDDTLPIVGYYPALIIMTAVMAWVWVVVAWVGMKSFRHAKVVGEEG